MPDTLMQEVVQLGLQARRQLWQVLSDLFLDTEVDYADIAMRLRAYPLDCVERALFQEVAPVCGWNLLTPVPPVWAGFDSQWLVTAIQARLAARRASVLRRFWDALWLPYWRCFLHGEWRTLQRAMQVSA